MERAKNCRPLSLEPSNAPKTFFHPVQQGSILIQVSARLKTALAADRHRRAAAGHGARLGGEGQSQSIFDDCGQSPMRLGRMKFRGTVQVVVYIDGRPHV